MADYPERLLRGITSPNDVIEGEWVTAKVFKPDERTAEKRFDGASEVSINWEDDENAVSFTLQMKNEKGFMFQGGVIRLCRADVDYIKNLPSVRKALSYERAPIDGNDYHGNLIFLSGLEKPIINQITQTLALHSSMVIPFSKK